jgi:hypothetical protein
VPREANKGKSISAKSSADENIFLVGETANHRLRSGVKPIVPAQVFSIFSLLPHCGNKELGLREVVWVNYEV